MVAVAAPTTADAGTPRWVSGNIVSANGIACGSNSVQIMVSTYAGYWGVPDGSFPQVGNVSYVRAAAAVVGNPCSASDALGFEFFLPAGATLAITAQTPVICAFTRLRDNVRVTNDSNLHCGQTPSTGVNGGLFFGWALSPSGFEFEVLVPVRFTQVLRGAASPANEKLGIKTLNSYGLLTATADVYVPAPIPLPITKSLALGQQVPFTGTSVMTHHEGAFVPVAGSTTPFSVPATSNVMLEVDLAYFYLSGPSQMGLDVRLMFDGAEVYRWRLGLNDDDADVLITNIPAGGHTVTLEVRSVLLGGPPTTVRLAGNYSGAAGTLRLF